MPKGASINDNTILSDCQAKLFVLNNKLSGEKTLLKSLNPSNLKTLLISGGLVGAMCVYSAPAYAQIDEIVVTARKVEENLQDVPVAVTAFTGEFFQDSGLVEISDIGRITPNFDIQENGVSGSAFANITIRGQTALNRELSSDQAVGITINGAPITRGTNIFSNLFDVEQIEVLKGPQGTLFGKNTTGGAVVITTTAPKLNEFSGYAEVDIGNFDRNDYEAVFNVGGETWALRFGAASQSRDGFNPGVRRDGTTVVTPLADGAPLPTNVFSFSNILPDLTPVSVALPDTVGFETGNDFADDDEEFYKVSALFEPNDQLSIRLNADYHEVDEAGQGTRVLHDGFLDLNVAVPNLVPVSGVAFTNVAVSTINDENFNAVSNQQDSTPAVIANETNLNGTISYDFGNFNVTSITSYRDQELTSNNPFAGGGVTVFIGQESDIFAQELRFSGQSLNDRLQWQFGGFYADEQGTDTDNVAAIRLTGAENETIAAFAQATYAVNDRLNITGGIRYTEEDRSLELITESRPGGAFISVPPEEVSFDGTSWLASLDYAITDDAIAYASISRGFRSGGIDDERLNLLDVEPPVDADGNIIDVTIEDITIDPEFVLNYEVGLKGDFFDNTLRWNTAAFYSDYTDIQVQTFDPVLLDPNGQAVQTLANGAEAEVYGFETELTYVPNDKLSLGGTVGYTKADFQEFVFTDPANPGTVIDRSEDAIGGPEWQASAFVRYEDYISDGIRAGAQLNITHRGSEQLIDGLDLPTFVNAGLADQEDLDSYEIVNGQIDFDIEQYDLNVAFYGRNIFDTEFDSTGFGFIALGLPLSQRAPGAPRTYGVRVRKSF